MIAIVGVVFGGIAGIAAIVAVIYAHLANRKAGDANKIADAAKSLAKTANDIAARGEARAVERHDVHWEGDWDPARPGRYLLRKRGRDEARCVRAKVYYDGDEQTAANECLTGDGGLLTFWFEGALTDYQEEYAERRERDDIAASGIPALSPYIESSRPVAERVEWETPLGTSKLHECRSLTTFDAYFESRGW